MWRRTLAGPRRSKGQGGQSLVETAIAIPLVLGIAFNLINMGYFWYMALTLSAAPRMGVQYATQGGTAESTGAPSATVVGNLANQNLTNAIANAEAVNANVSVQVCIGVVQNTNTPKCTNVVGSHGNTPPLDPESPNFSLDSVDVWYTVTPIIPGTFFNVVLPSNLTFHRKVYMRSLF